MRYATLRLALEPPVARVTLARPDDANPIDVRFVDELDAAAAAIADAPAVSVVQLAAEGSVFSRGWSGPPPPAGAGAFRCLELLPQPLVAALQGDAMGAGLELALACDVRLAAAGARFGLPAPGDASARCGGTQRLPRLIGRTRAAAMLLLGEHVDAAKAESWGLVNEVARDPAALRGRLDALTAALAARGPLALRYAKEAVGRGLDLPLEQALRFETDLTVILQTTADRAEGVGAFLEKRPPRFTGR